MTYKFFISNHVKISHNIHHEIVVASDEIFLVENTPAYVLRSSVSTFQSFSYYEPPKNETNDMICHDPLIASNWTRDSLKPCVHVTESKTVSIM